MEFVGKRNSETSGGMRHVEKERVSTFIDNKVSQMRSLRNDGAMRKLERKRGPAVWKRFIDDAI